MPTPSKPANILKMEGKSHRTKKELEQREKYEESLTTGITLKERTEVRNNKIAHKEFLRINKLLKNIDKNDAIYEAVINRYCMLQAECFDFEEKRESFYNDLEELTNDKDKFGQEGELSLSSYYKMKSNMQSQIIALDKQIQTKRKMLLNIEKENIMTIASSLRSIPKKVEEKPKENKFSRFGAINNG